MIKNNILERFSAGRNQQKLTPLFQLSIEIWRLLITISLKTLKKPENAWRKLLNSINDINYYLGCAYENLGQKEEAWEFFEKASKGLDIPASAMFYKDQPPETIFYQGLALLKLNDG